MLNTRQCCFSSIIHRSSFIIVLKRHILYLISKILWPNQSQSFRRAPLWMARNAQDHNAEAIFEGFGRDRKSGLFINDRNEIRHGHLRTTSTPEDEVFILKRNLTV